LTKAPIVSSLRTVLLWTWRSSDFCHWHRCRAPEITKPSGRRAHEVAPCGHGRQGPGTAIGRGFSASRPENDRFGRRAQSCGAISINSAPSNSRLQPSPKYLTAFSTISARSGRPKGEVHASPIGTLSNARGFPSNSPTPACPRENPTKTVWRSHPSAVQVK
jgi:hypothetical protein